MPTGLITPKTRIYWINTTLAELRRTIRTRVADVPELPESELAVTPVAGQPD